MVMHASTDPDSTSAPRAGKPWRTAVAGLLLLGIAGGMMAYGAPSRAAVPSHSQPAQAGALVSATPRLGLVVANPARVQFRVGFGRLQEGSGEDLRSAIPRSSPEAWCRHT
jgi:hypothetical protein